MNLFYNKFNKNFLAILLISGIVGVFFFPLFYPTLKLFVTPDFGQSDLWQLNYPLKYSLSTALKSNSLPLWNSAIGAGFPQLAEGQAGALNIFNVVLFKALPFVLAINIGYISIFLTSSIGTFLYLRFLQRSLFASLFSAILFAFSGFFIAHISHFNLIQAASFLPFIFLLTHRYIQTKKNLLTTILLLAIVLSQQYFSGFPQISFISLCGIFGLVTFSYFRKEISLKKTILFGSVIVVFLALIAIQLLPSYEFLQLSTRKGGFSQSQASYFSFPLKHLKTLIDPYALGDPRNGTYPRFTQFDGSVFWENTGFIGVIPLILAVFSLFLFRKKKEVPFYILLVGGAVLLMLGKFSPLYFMYSIPPFSFFRVPSRFILLFIWGLCVLSSFGFDYLIDTFKKNKIKNVVLFPTILLMIILSFWQLFSFGFTYNPLGDAERWLAPPAVAAFLQKQKDARYFTIGSSEKWDAIFSKSGWTKSESFLPFHNDLVPNENLLYGLSSYQVYPILVTRRYQRMSALLQQNLFASDDNSTITENGKKLLSLNSISYIISPRALKNSKLVHRTSGYFIYKINAVQYTRRIASYTVVDTVEGMEKQLLDKNFDPQKQVILEEKPTPDSTLLVISQTYYPGWEALVDGKKTKIYPANLNQMAIVVPKGEYSVHFTYKPQSFMIGKVISILSYLAIVLLMVFPTSFFHLRISSAKGGPSPRS